MPLYYVSTDRGCGIRQARDLGQAERMAKRESGANNVKEVRKATSADIAWVRGMGGHVPAVGKTEKP